jgi:hypothetical protein
MAKHGKGSGLSGVLKTLSAHRVRVLKHLIKRNEVWGSSPSRWIKVSRHGNFSPALAVMKRSLVARRSPLAHLEVFLLSKCNGKLAMNAPLSR